MAGAIANAALMISANFGQMTQGLNTASGQISQFSGAAGKGLSSVLGSLGGGIGSGFSAMAGLASKAGNALSNLGPWGMAAAAGIGAVAALAGPVSDAIDRMASSIKAADTLGVSFGFASSIGDKLGGVEALTKMMVKLDTVVGDAGNGNEAAAHKIRSLGLSVKELEGLNPEQTFLRMTDSLAAMPNAADRAAAAHDIFGRKAAEILPLLAKGPGAIQEFINKEAAFGATDFSSGQLSQITAAKSAWREVSLSVKGATSIMGSAFAPVVEILGNLVSSAWLAIKPVVQLVGNVLNVIFSLVGMAFKPIAIIFRAIGAALELLATPLNFLLGIFSSISSWFGKVADSIGSKITTMAASVKSGIGSSLSWVWDKVKGILGTASDVTGLTKVGSLVKSAWSWLDDKTGISSWFSFLRSQSKETEQQAERTRRSLDVQAKVDELLTSLTKVNQQNGMTDVEKQIDDLKRLGATENQLQEVMSQARANQGQQFEMENDPTIALRRTMTRLDDLYAHGAVSAQVYQHQVNRAMSDAERSLSIGTEFKAAAAVFAGSSQAIETITRASLEQPDSPADRANRIAERQLQVQERLLQVFEGTRTDLQQAGRVTGGEWI